MVHRPAAAARPRLNPVGASPSQLYPPPRLFGCLCLASSDGDAQLPPAEPTEGGQGQEKPGRGRGPPRPRLGEGYTAAAAAARGMPRGPAQSAGRKIRHYGRTTAYDVERLEASACRLRTGHFSTGRATPRNAASTDPRRVGRRGPHAVANRREPTPPRALRGGAREATPRRKPTRRVPPVLPRMRTCSHGRAAALRDQARDRHGVNDATDGRHSSDALSRGDKSPHSARPPSLPCTDGQARRRRRAVSPVPTRTTPSPAHRVGERHPRAHRWAPPVPHRKMLRRGPCKRHGGPRNTTGHCTSTDVNGKTEKESRDASVDEHDPLARTLYGRAAPPSTSLGAPRARL